MPEEYEYRVKATTPGQPDATAGPTADPKAAGSVYRDWRGVVKDNPGNGGGTVELQRRRCDPWETVERAVIDGSREG